MVWRVEAERGFLSRMLSAGSDVAEIGTMLSAGSDVAEIRKMLSAVMG